MDQTLVDQLRISSDATDTQIQDKLKQLYSTTDLKSKQDQALQQILSTQTTASESILAIYEHQILLDDQFKMQLFQTVSNDDQYAEMIQQLEDPEQANEVIIGDKTYRIKNRTLKVHEREQKTTAVYWRTVIPNTIDITRMILHELHYVPYSGHPGFMRTLELAKNFFY